MSPGLGGAPAGPSVRIGAGPPGSEPPSTSRRWGRRPAAEAQDTGPWSLSTHMSARSPNPQHLSVTIWGGVFKEALTLNGVTRVAFIQHDLFSQEEIRSQTQRGQARVQAGHAVLTP